ncbi:MAG: hypothetical protein CR996_01445 [Draconibacterium sp.]|nr:MAG: hypothetical protein CR996_01445 [Draconibacterium sp.]PIF05573.1 MAG: hypothetical protein CSA36_06160 [Draconibacterium sp.]
MWTHKSADNRSIQQAIDCLIPYIEDKKEWKHQQPGNLDKAMEKLKIDYLMAASFFGDEKYANIAATIKDNGDFLDKLIYPIENQY